MATTTEGRHWAVICEGDIDYLDGRKFRTAKEAEREWRRVQGLCFIPVTVRRTTDEEDRKLPA